MSLSIFISHSFGHAEKLLGVTNFIRNRGIKHVAHSVPAWAPYAGPDVQTEIESRVRRSDRVIVILTKGIHKSPWIEAEIKWAHKYGKPIIAVWPHGEAGEAIPRIVADSDPYFSGWRATSLEKALKLKDVGDYRALDLAEDVDRELLFARVVQGAGIASLFLVAADLAKLKRMQEQLRANGYQVSFNKDQLDILFKGLIGAAVGGLLGCVVAELCDTTRGISRQFALGGALLGGGVAIHRHLKAEIRALGPLMQIDLSA